MLNSLGDYYRGRRVLITGHTGFKGSWLAHWLKMLGAELCGIALPPDTTPSIFELIRGDEGMASHHVDLANAVFVQRIVQQFQPEIIFHLAAQSLVRRSYAQPAQTFMTNVMGTAHILDAARTTASVRAVLVVTSDKVYRNAESGRAFVEDDALGGHDPYSASKACAEIITESWRSSFFHECGSALLASARAGNVFGGGDWCADRLLPDIVRALASDQPVMLRNPDSSRPWQYVLEALSGYLLLGMRLAQGDAGFSESWNFGPLSDESITVGDFTQRVVDAWGHGSVARRQDTKAPREATILRLDSTKSRTRLGWKPVLPLQEAIEWSVQWHRTVLVDPSQAAFLTTAQIESFSECLQKAGISAALVSGA